MDGACTLSKSGASHPTIEQWVNLNFCDAPQRTLRPLDVSGWNGAKHYEGAVRDSLTDINVLEGGWSWQTPTLRLIRRRKS